MKRNVFFGSMLLLILFGCRKTPDFDELSYDFTVSTTLDKSAQFGDYNTFYISDTVKYIGGIGSDSILVGPNADLLTKVVKDSLTARGYSLVPLAQNPDLGVTVTAIKDLNVVINQYPGWWDPWYGGCYWYYWCYGYYYPWTSVYTYTTGTVFLNMYDLKHANEDQQLRGLWNITALGALGSSTAGNFQLGVDALKQGFAQSPYVKTN